MVLLKIFSCRSNGRKVIAKKKELLSCLLYCAIGRELHPRTNTMKTNLLDVAHREHYGMNPLVKAHTAAAISKEINAHANILSQSPRVAADEKIMYQCVTHNNV